MSLSTSRPLLETPTLPPLREGILPLGTGLLSTPRPQDALRILPSRLLSRRQDVQERASALADRPSQAYRKGGEGPGRDSRGATIVNGTSGEGTSRRTRTIRGRRGRWRRKGARALAPRWWWPGLGRRTGKGRPSEQTRKRIQRLGAIFPGLRHSCSRGVLRSCMHGFSLSPKPNCVVALRMRDMLDELTRVIQPGPIAMAIPLPRNPNGAIPQPIVSFCPRLPRVDGCRD